MDKNKTGRLIRRKRKEMGLSGEQLAELLGVTNQAVNSWETGNRYTDPSSQVMIYKHLGLNPVELLTGLEMYDDDLKKRISYYMSRIDENVLVAGMGTDEDGNEIYIDLSGYEIYIPNNDVNQPGKFVSYLEYHNVLPPEKPNLPEPLPVKEYDPTKIYINHRHSIFVIPVEILEAVGKPLYFDVKQNVEKGIIALQFTDDPQSVFDIPEKVYNGKWKGIHVFGDEFAKQLCEEMGIRRRMDPVEIEPEYLEKSHALLLHLDKANVVNVTIDHSKYLLPQWQYDVMCEEDEEPEDDEWEEEE